MDHFSFIDVEAAEQREERQAARHASILFSQRASERFESFLRQAAHKDEFDARLSMVRGDILRTAAELTDAPEPLVDAFVERLAGGAFCDDCRKWKNGPKSLCTCADESKNDQGLMEDAPSAVGEKSSSVKTACECNDGDSCRCGSDCKDCACDKKESAVQRPAFHVVASDSTGLSDEPSGPKINKSKGGDSRGYDHTEVPAKSGDKQDVADSPDYDKDYSEKMEDVTKLHKEEKGPHTKTWSGKDGQADPVTSHFLSSTDIDSALAQS